jgi:hypothetical protein
MHFVVRIHDAIGGAADASWQEESLSQLGSVTRRKNISESPQNFTEKLRNNPPLT